MEKWIPWHGGECPIADGVEFRVRFRNDKETKPHRDASRWRWSHVGHDYDIVAYCVEEFK